MSIFYKPMDGWAADFIPFYDKGAFQLFYLHDYRDRERHGEGTPWRLLRTHDFRQFDEVGEVISRGKVDEQDLYVFTGSVFKKKDGDYWLFYTGHNPHFTDKPVQKILLARSNDLVHWTKTEKFSLQAPLQGFEPDDWRDPFVYIHPVTGKYRMLLAARKKSGGARHRGCTVVLESEDLLNWSEPQLFWDPNLYFTHECPDLFQIGSHWYLLFSEFSYKRVTHYRIADSADGPWRTPADGGVIDGPAFYAAKTATDGTNRFLFGWNPTKADESDDNPWQWGGNLVVHELHARADGTLGLYLPKTVADAYAKTVFTAPTFAVGAAGVCRYGFPAVDVGEAYRISCDITVDDAVTQAGVAIRYDDDKDDSYWYAVEPKNDRLRFDKYPNEAWHFTNFLGLTKKIDVRPNRRYHLDILVDGDVCVAWFEGGVALSSRMYQNRGGRLAFVSIEGITKFENITVRIPEGM